MRQLRVRVGLAVALVASAAAVGTAFAEKAPAAATGGAPTAAREFNRLPRLPAECLELAQRYAEGRGVRQDTLLAARWAFVASYRGAAAARKWLEGRAAGGDAVAQLYLGAALRAGAREQQDPKAAATWLAMAIPALQRAAEGNDAPAQTALAFAHENGHGVPTDAKAARTWLERAAAVHYLPAVTGLGVMLVNGYGGPKNPQDGLKILEGAAVLGDHIAQRHAGDSHRAGVAGARDGVRAARWYELAANAGDAESQFNLARMKESAEGIPADLAGARALYRRSADQGLGGAASNLGIMLQTGMGGPVDLAGAIELYRLAVDNGNAFGASNLGYSYRDGIGVPMDLAEARRWFEKAVALGNDSAKKPLARIDGLRRCYASKPSTQLFDVPLRCATRDRLRRAVAQGGAKPKREDFGYFYDIYDSAAVLDGTSKLEIGYTEGDEFARAVYHFHPEGMDTQHIVRVAEMVSLKYGKFHSRTGRVDLGPASFEWRLKDGIVLRVSRDWPNPTAYLEYIYPERFTELKKQADAADANRKVKKAAAQSRAF